MATTHHMPPRLCTAPLSFPAVGVLLFCCPRTSAAIAGCLAVLGAAWLPSGCPLPCTPLPASSHGPAVKCKCRGHKCGSVTVVCTASASDAWVRSSTPALRSTRRRRWAQTLCVEKHMAAPQMHTHLDGRPIQWHDSVVEAVMLQEGLPPKLPAVHPGQQLKHLRRQLGGGAAAAAGMSSVWRRTIRGIGVHVKNGWHHRWCPKPAMPATRWVAPPTLTATRYPCIQPRSTMECEPSPSTTMSSFSSTTNCSRVSTRERRGWENRLGDGRATRADWR